MKLNEYDKIQLQGVAMDTLIEKIWAERDKISQINKDHVSRKKSRSKNIRKRK